jgi:hypothetical protein
VVGSPSPPGPLRGANIGFADIISRARERGSRQTVFAYPGAENVREIVPLG